MKSFWKKKLPSLLLALLMMVSLVPAAAAASADLTYTVAPGSKVTFDIADFSALKSYDYLVFTEYSKLDSFGKFTAYDQDGDKVTLAKKDLDNLWFYYDEDDIEYDSDCDLDTLTFVADANAAGTLTLTFELWKDDAKKYTGTVAIKIGGTGSSSSSSNIVFTMEEDDDITFDADDFKEYFNETYTGSLKYIRFTDISNLDECGVLTTYVNDNDDWETVDLDEDDALDGYFFFSDNDVEDKADYYCLDGLGFESDDNTDGEVVTLDFTAYGTTSSKKVNGTMRIEIGDVKSSGSSSADITYTLDEDDDVSFKLSDFKAYFNKSYTGSPKYVRFTDISNLDDCGVLTTYVNDNDDWETVDLDEDDALDGYFYYSDDDVEDESDSYCLDGLGFESDKNTDGKVVTLDFTIYGTTSSKKVNGTVAIEIGDVRSSASVKGDIEYTAKAEKEVELDEDDFFDFFRKSYNNYDLKYVVFTGAENLSSSNGYLYYNYERPSEVRFTASDLDSAYFYYNEDEIPGDTQNCYPLDDMSFVAGKKFASTAVLNFTAYYSSSKKVSGTLTISPAGGSSSGTSSGSTSAESSNLAANILYTTTSGTNVPLKATDFARFYESAVPNSTLKSVKLLAVPSTGGLYYNYYGKSAYGTAARLQLTASNCTGLTLYSSPSDTTDYSLTELTYVPASNSTNYTASIPFTATGTGNHSVSGIVMISVTAKAIPEVYGVTPKNTSVSFPAPAITSAVKSGTSAALSEIQLLELPASKVGTIYVGTGTSRKANLSDLYGVSGSSWTINQLRFVPASGYTGNVKIPYLAYDTNGKSIGVGTFSLGIVNKQVSFRDVSSSTWCYKYVAELSDSGVVSGYTDGSFKPNNTITYGAALKLIMLAAGYGEQAPTVKGSTFSGYLDKARAEGIITRSNVNLSGPITRLQVAQLAAGAMKLDLDNLSSVAPFTDTTDKNVQALNEAGIVEGYFSNGTSTYKPGNTLTRGQVSAIVWRMQNYQ
jgi:hypothetical protein